MTRRFRYSGWQQTVITLFCGIFLLQFIPWFSEYWLSSTRLYVIHTLILTFIIEVLPKVHWLLKRIIQLVCLVLMLMIRDDFQWVGGPFHSLKDAQDLIYHNFQQIDTYFWIVMATWAIYTACIWWVNEKSRIFALVGVSVITLAIVDSYSLLVLWDQIAIIIFCGLVQAILRHFEQFRIENPESWSTIVEYPSALAATVFVIISVVMTAGIMMPAFNPFITDPYTAWKNYNGEIVITSGKGIVQTSALTSDPTSNASSGYSRDDSVIGGGFNYDYSNVMMVKSDQKAYWRGETKSLYSGKGWELSNSDKKALTTPVMLGTVVPKEKEVNDALLKTMEVTQTFTMVSKDASYPVLFGAASIVKLDSIGSGAVGNDEKLTAADNLPTPVLWSSRQQELRWPEKPDNAVSSDTSANAVYPETYTVISQLPIIDETGLRSAPAVLPNPEVWQEYLQLPDTLPQRVRDLAQDITKEAANPYDKVKLIENYLRTHFKYTNKPNQALAQSDDFVDSFLFEVKEGYCDYYSTTMAVLTRTLGIPSRWVKGFSSGASFDEANGVLSDMPEAFRNEMALRSGLFTVRNSNAHSWVEVYFEGWGWIPFEPTAGFSLPQAKEKLVESVTEDSTAGTAENAKQSSAWLNPTMWITLISLIIIGALMFMIWKFRWYRSLVKLKRSGRESDLNQQVISEFNKFMRYSKRKGYVSSEYDTVRETIKRWIEQKRWIQKDFEMLLAIFERAKYSRSLITDEEAAKAIRIVKKLREQM